MTVQHNITITASDKTGKALSSVEGRLSSLGKTAGVAAGAVAALASGAVVGGIVKQYTEFERYNTVLKTYLGSQTRANAEMRRLVTLADSLPQDLADVTQAFTIFTRTGVDTSSKSLTAFSNIATANGKSLTQLGEAVADALTGEFERLKEFGIKVSKENDKFVADIGNGQKIIGNSSQELVNKLRALGEEGGKFGSAAANNANTLSQAFSNLQGALFSTSVTAGGSASAGLKTLVETMTQLIRQNQALMASLGRVISQLSVGLAQTLTFVAENFDWVRKAVIAFLAVKLGAGIAGLILGFKNLTAAIAGTVKGLTQMNKASMRNIVGAVLALGLVLADTLGLLDGVYRKLGLLGEDDTISPLTQRLTQLNSTLAEIQGVQNRQNSQAYKDALDTATVLERQLEGKQKILDAAKAEYAQSLKAGQVNVKALATINEYEASIGAARGSLAELVDLFKVVNTQSSGLNQSLESPGLKLYNDTLKTVTDNVAAEEARVDALRRANIALSELVLTEQQRINIQEVVNLLTKDQLDAAQQLIKSLSEQNAELTIYQGALENVSSLVAGTTVTEQQATDALNAKIKALKGTTESTATYESFVSDLHKALATEAQQAEWAQQASWDLIQARADGVISADYLTAALKRLNGEQKAELTSSQQILKTYQDNVNNLAELQQAYINADDAVAGTGLSVEEFRRQLLKQMITLTDATQGVEDFKTAGQIAAEELRTTWESIGQSMSKSMADAVAQGKFTFNSFKDFLKGWAQEIVSQIVQKSLMDPITSQLAQLGSGIVGSITGGSGSGGGLGGMIAGLFTGGSGMQGSFTDLFTGSFLGFAAGGTPPVGKTSIVGEKGPELFVPKSAGTIVPNHELGGGALNVTFQINAIDATSGTEFILNNKQQIVGVIQEAYNRRGKAGIY